MVELTPEQFEAAKARGEKNLRRGPLAESARYDEARNRIIVRLDTGAEIDFAPADAQGLENATPAELADVEIVEFGLGLHWPTLDADHWVPALAEGRLGSDKWIEHRAAREPRALARAPHPPSEGRPMRTIHHGNMPAGQEIRRDSASGRFISDGETGNRGARRRRQRKAPPGQS